MSEKTDLINDVNGPIALNLSLPRGYRWPWQRAIAGEVLQASGKATLQAVNERLLVAMATTEHLARRLIEEAGQSREQILQEMAIHIDQQITIAEELYGDEPNNQ